MKRLGNCATCSVCCLAIAFLAFGCIVDLTGEGQVGVRMRNDNSFAFFHEAEMEKVGVTSRSESSLNESGMSLIFGADDAGTGDEPDAGAGGGNDG